MQGIAMNITRLILRSLSHYWRSHLAVLLGVVIGTAVITGAMIVGDSVKFSLRKMTFDRLGRIDHALTSHRFFREDLADDILQVPQFRERFEAIAPGLLVHGALERIGEGGSASGVSHSLTRIGRVNVYGVDERLWELTNNGDVAAPEDRDVVVSSRTAEELGVGPGDELTAWIELPTNVPRDSLLGGGEKAVSVELVLTVRSVLEAGSGVGRLGLKPNQQLPKNAFVALKTLQSALGLSQVRPSRREPEGRAARVNALFVGAKHEADRTGSDAAAAASELTQLLSESLKLGDLQLRLRKNEKRGYVTLESDQMFLEDAIAAAGQAAAKQLGMRQSPVLIYLANEIANAKDADAYSMYSVIAGVDFATCREPPFGPFRSANAPESLVEIVLRPAAALAASQKNVASSADQIVLNQWLAQDLKARPGTAVKLRYHRVGSHGELPEEERVFKVTHVVTLDGTPADDRGFTPEVKGITDVDDMAGWDQPFPMRLDRITQRDEDYWDRYRATPKAFVSLSTAQELWRSRYGDLTSLRLAPLPETSVEQSARQFERAFLDTLDPSKLDLAFQPVKFDGLQAASGTTDFSGLFIGLSFFLILSAVILIGLLFRLGIERRAPGIGLLRAVGFRQRRAQWLFLGEGLFVVLVGAVFGLIAGAGYAAIMVYGLKTWWLGAIGTQFLFVDLQVSTLATGFVIAVCVAGASVWWGFRGLRRISARELLAGATDVVVTAAAQRKRGIRTRQIAFGSIAVAVTLLVASLVGLVPASEAFFGLSWQTVSFFVVGLCVLTACLTSLSAWLDSDLALAIRGAGVTGLARLGLRNASRNRQRSVLSTGLIASAAFVIVAVAAGRRNPAVETPVKQSENGGFLFVAETPVPVIANLNTEEGRAKADLTYAADSPEARLIEKMRVAPFRVKPGEDASCLNIYQTRLPSILGVPHAMVVRGGFKFANASVTNPWSLLEETPEDGTIPVLGDMATLMYSLYKGIGDTIGVPDDESSEHQLKIVGMLDGSVFQSYLLMSEKNFLRLFPEQAGYQYFLIGDGRDEAAGDQRPDAALTESEAKKLRELLETRLAQYGFDAERVADRLTDLLAIQNTYLSTFQTLGGLGLLLGTFGLATVMLRNVVERRRELALLRAVGFTGMKIAILVLLENAILLLWGLATGTISALLAMTPHLTSVGADVPWHSGGLTLGAVFIIGMLAAFAAVSEAVRTRIVESLASE